MRLIFLILLLPFFSYAESLNVGLDIKFKSGSTVIDGSGLEVIKNFIDLQKTAQSYNLVISGHTDSLGDSGINQELSIGRAKAVKKALLERGAQEKIIVKGFGELAPIADNNTNSGRAKNRRVVVSIVGLSSSDITSVKNNLLENKNLKLIKTENDQVNAYVEQVAKKSEIVKVEPKLESKNIQKIEKDKHRYLIGLGGYNNVLGAEDVASTGANKEAEWVSSINYNMQAAYQYRLGLNLWVGVKAEYHLFDYNVEKQSSYAWDEENPNLMKLALITDYEPSKKWSLGFDVNYDEEAFIYVIPPEITLREDVLVGVSVRGAYKFYDSKKMSSRLKLKLNYPIVGFDDVLKPKGELGFLVGLDSSFKNLIKSHELHVEIYYGLKNFEHLENTQSETLVGLNFNIRNNLWF